MKKVCAWCGKKLSGTGHEISHGICVKCFAAILQGQFDFVEEIPKVEPLPATRRGRKSSTMADAMVVQSDFPFPA